MCYYKTFFCAKSSHPNFDKKSSKIFIKIFDYQNYYIYILYFLKETSKAFQTRINTFFISCISTVSKAKLFKIIKCLLESLLYFKSHIKIEKQLNRRFSAQLKLEQIFFCFVCLSLNKATKDINECFATCGCCHPCLFLTTLNQLHCKHINFSSLTPSS